MNPMGGDQKPMAGDPKAQGDNKGDQKPSAGTAGRRRQADERPVGHADGRLAERIQAVERFALQRAAVKRSAVGRPAEPKDPAQENVQQAVPPQRGAQEDIDKNKRNDASKKQDEAIQALERALKELEKRLKQLREKELAKLLANLEERVGRMLRMQIEVKAATVNIDNGIKKNKGRRPRPISRSRRSRPTRKWRSSPRPTRRSS